MTGDASTPGQEATEAPGPEKPPETDAVQEAPCPIETAAAETEIKALFHASWSPSSIMCIPHAEAAGHQTYDVDENPQLADRWQIWSVPTVVVVGPKGLRRRTTGAGCVAELTGEAG